MSELAVRAEVVDRPRLDALAEIVRTEHAEIRGAFERSLRRAIAIGEALLEAKTLVGHEPFADWVERECGIVSQTANFYTRVAHYQQALPDGLNYTEAVEFLRGLPPTNGKRPSTPYPEAIRQEARRRRKQGETFQSIADALGIEKSTIQYFCNPSRSKSREQAKARTRALLRAEKREALRQQAEIEARKRGGSIAKAWSLVHLLSQELDRASAEHARGAPIRKDLRDAYSFSSAVERHIAKALGIEYGSWMDVTGVSERVPSSDLPG